MIGSKIQVKSPEQIVAMRRAGLVVCRGLAAMTDAVKPGITTEELNQIGIANLKEHEATSNFLNYGAEWGYTPFPSVACLSVNDVVVHGISSDQLIMEPGDIISVDYGAIVDGWHGDAARTVFAGEPSDEAAKLSEVTYEAMWVGIAAAWTGSRVGDISAAIQGSIRAAGTFGIVKEYTGHGIGTQMHMDPDVPNWGKPHKGPRLRPGMCLAIEPIVTLGTEKTAELDDGWTVVTADGSWAAHWENTVAICSDGLWVLTEPDGGRAELEKRGIPVASLADQDPGAL